MQARKDSSAQVSNGDAHHPLPDQLARGLAPKLRHALMHGMRRRILRALSGHPTPRTTKDLLSVFPGINLSIVNYHVLVLDECGCVSVASVEHAGGSFVRSFASQVADDAQFVAVLRATEQLDDVR